MTQRWNNADSLRQAVSPELFAGRSLAGARILVLVPQQGFDPTEAAVPFDVLSGMGAELTFAAPDAAQPAMCDPIMIDGVGLYLLKWSMRADASGIAAYRKLEESALLRPGKLITYEVARSRIGDFDALLLPGGHCPDMRPYLESDVAQSIVKAFNEKPAGSNTIAAICHGVVLAARSGILAGRDVTSLERWQERLAHSLTRLWMGNYYTTYPQTSVQDEVSMHCRSFLSEGSWSTHRDSLERPFGFVVKDGNLVTARWPGDAHAFALVLGSEVLKVLTARRQSTPEAH